MSLQRFYTNLTAVIVMKCVVPTVLSTPKRVGINLTYALSFDGEYQYLSKTITNCDVTIPIMMLHNAMSRVPLITFAI